MKSFIITLIIFSALLGTIATNFFYINKVGDELKEKAETLDISNIEECKAQLDELYLYWKDNETMISFSVSYTELNCVDDNITKMMTYLEHNDIVNFECYRASLLNAIEEMRRLEKLLLKNIF